MEKGGRGRMGRGDGKMKEIGDVRAEANKWCRRCGSKRWRVKSIQAGCYGSGCRDCEGPGWPVQTNGARSDYQILRILPRYQ